VSEHEGIAGLVVVLQTVIDRRRRGGRPHRLAADGEVAEKDPLLGDLQPRLDLRAVLGLPDHGFGLRDPIGHPAFELAVLRVQHGDGLERRHELVVLLVDPLAAHRPFGVNLRGVVRPELLGVL